MCVFDSVVNDPHNSALELNIFKMSLRPCVWWSMQKIMIQTQTYFFFNLTSDNIKTKRVYLLLPSIGHKSDCKSKCYLYSHYILYAYLLLLISLYLTAILPNFVISSRTIKLFFRHKQIPGICYSIL